MPPQDQQQTHHTQVSKERLRALPRSPGVYLMKDRGGEVIYIGKAKDLKSRVSSYFGKGDGRISLEYLVARTSQIETLVTEDERQALILEADLIKKYRPRYNVRLKDDRAYLIVRVDRNAEWPRLELVRQTYEDGALYLGPFAFSHELRTMLEVIKRSIPLRTCSDHVLHNRMRPCLEYQIKRCAGPCCLPVDPKQYDAWLGQAIELLRGHTEEVREELIHEMERASEDLRFEDAAVLRDRIQVLQRISEDKQQVRFGEGAMDAFGMYREGSNLELSVLMVRQGRLFESKTFGFTEVEVPSEEVLSSLLTQFYTASRDIPRDVLIPLLLEDAAVHEELLAAHAGRPISITYPERGMKARLLALAARNAKENFEARFSEVSKADRVLKALQVELGLESMPRLIECVDISHFQGGATVGAVITFKDGRPEKSRYRLFHLSQEGKPDDFASMREVVLRHLSRCAEENTVSDLMVIDGGPAQLSQALAMRKELGLSGPPMASLAKKRALGSRLPQYFDSGPLPSFKKPERIYLEEKKVPLILSPENEALQLLERIRNEAHRFVITFHRKTRSNKTFRSVLDNIPGIGPTRKRRLLKEFRSMEALRAATPEEISTRCEMPLSLARRVEKLLAKGSSE